MAKAVTLAELAEAQGRLRRALCECRPLSWTYNRRTYLIPDRYERGAPLCSTSGHLHTPTTRQETAIIALQSAREVDIQSAIARTIADLITTDRPATRAAHQEIADDIPGHAAKYLTT